MPGIKYEVKLRDHYRGEWNLESYGYSIQAYLNNKLNAVFPEEINKEVTRLISSPNPEAEEVKEIAFEADLIINKIKPGAQLINQLTINSLVQNKEKVQYEEQWLKPEMITVLAIVGQITDGGELMVEIGETLKLAQKLSEKRYIDRSQVLSMVQKIFGGEWKTADQALSKARLSKDFNKKKIDEIRGVKAELLVALTLPGQRDNKKMELGKVFQVLKQNQEVDIIYYDPFLERTIILEVGATIERIRNKLSEKNSDQLTRLKSIANANKWLPAITTPELDLRSKIEQIRSLFQRAQKYGFGLVVQGRYVTEAWINSKMVKDQKPAKNINLNKYKPATTNSPTAKLLLREQLQDLANDDQYDKGYDKGYQLGLKDGDYEDKSGINGYGRSLPELGVSYFDEGMEAGYEDGYEAAFEE